MSRQGSDKIAELIDVRQRLRRADDQLDKLLAERNALAERLNELDPVTNHAFRRFEETWTLSGKKP